MNALCIKVMKKRARGFSSVKFKWRGIFFRAQVREAEGSPVVLGESEDGHLKISINILIVSKI